MHLTYERSMWHEPSRLDFRPWASSTDGESDSSSDDHEEVEEVETVKTVEEVVAIPNLPVEQLTSWFEKHPPSEYEPTTPLELLQPLRLHRQLERLFADPKVRMKMTAEPDYLIAAIDIRDREMFDWLLTTGRADPNGSDGMMTPLIAALHKAPEFVGRLLQAGADPNLRTGIDGYFGVGVIDIVCSAKRFREQKNRAAWLETVTSLFEAGLNVSRPEVVHELFSDEFVPELFDLIWPQTGLEAASLLDVVFDCQGPDLLNHVLMSGAFEETVVDPKSGSNLLHQLPQALNHDGWSDWLPKIFTRAITHGVDINGRDTNGETPLHRLATASVGFIELLDAYLGAGADPTARTIAGESVIDRYVKPVIRIRDLHQRRILPSTIGLDRLIDAGARITTGDPTARPTLFRLLDRCHPIGVSRTLIQETISVIELIERLIERGADPTERLRDSAGQWSAAGWAARNNYPVPVINALIAAGSDFDLLDEDGIDRLLPTILIEKTTHPASVTPKYRFLTRMSPVFAECRAEMKRHWSRRLPLDLESTDRAGRTLVRIAVDQQDFDLMIRLLTLKIDPRIKADDGKNSFDAFPDHWWTRLAKTAKKTTLPPLITKFLDFRRKRGSVFAEESCVICTVEKPDTVYTPCGHRCVCESCAIEYHEKCPICQTKVRRVIVDAR